METGSFMLYLVGGILVAFAFGFHVIHAALLAGGRRFAAVFNTQRQPAFAGISGSFVEAQLGGGIGGNGRRATTSSAAPFAIGFAYAAWASLATSLLLRAIVEGRGPWGNMYEFAVAFAFGILTGYLFMERRYPIRSLGFVPLGVSLVLLIYSSTLPSNVERLVPALQNNGLLTIHVGMAMLSYGIFAMSFAAAIGYLAQGATDRFAWLPTRKVLDEVAYRSVIVGFPVFAMMIVLGSYWASIAWSAYWSWDPKETSALVTWLIYAIYLHARNQRGLAGRPSAIILVIGFLMVLVTFSGNLWFPGLHSYSGLTN